MEWSPQWHPVAKALLMHIRLSSPVIGAVDRISTRAACLPPQPRFSLSLYDGFVNLSSGKEVIQHALADMFLSWVVAFMLAFQRLAVVHLHYAHKQNVYRLSGVCFFLPIPSSSLFLLVVAWERCVAQSVSSGSPRPRRAGWIRRNHSREFHVRPSIRKGAGALHPRLVQTSHDVLDYSGAA